MAYRNGSGRASGLTQRRPPCSRWVRCASSLLIIQLKHRCCSWRAIDQHRLEDDHNRASSCGTDTFASLERARSTYESPVGNQLRSALIYLVTAQNRRSRSRGRRGRHPRCLPRRFDQSCRKKQRAFSFTFAESGEHDDATKAAKGEMGEQLLVHVM